MYHIAHKAVYGPQGVLFEISFADRFILPESLSDKAVFLIYFSEDGSIGYPPYLRRSAVEFPVTFSWMRGNDIGPGPPPPAQFLTRFRQVSSHHMEFQLSPDIGHIEPGYQFYVNVRIEERDCGGMGNFLFFVTPQPASEDPDDDGDGIPDEIDPEPWAYTVIPG